MISLVNAIGNICICPGEGLPKVSQQLLKWSILTSYAKNGPDSLVKLLHQVFPFKTIPSTLAITDKKARAITGKQTKHSNAFIREYDEVKSCKLHSLPPGVHPRQKMQHDVCQDDNVVIPQYSRVLRVKDNGGDGDSSKDRFEVAFGVPWTEHTFIAEAVKKGHPSNIFDALSPGIIRAIEANCKWKPEEVIFASR